MRSFVYLCIDERWIFFFIISLCHLQSNGEEIYKVSEEDVFREQLHFIKFETKYIETCLDFIKQNLIGSKEFMRVNYFISLIQRQMTDQWRIRGSEGRAAPV